MAAKGYFLNVTSILWIGSHSRYQMTRIIFYLVHCVVVNAILLGLLRQGISRSTATNRLKGP